ncbi:enoyl reductase [Ustulina deusta]|nr:enoyl reductase [Ustulina deusta]KAI3332925.1 enoyl reductase [Ustulina deusta]
MEALPSSQRAFKVRGSGEAELVESCPLPDFEEDEVLVRVRCVAINPVDVKVLDMAPHVGATIGCEFAGDVVRRGRGVKNGRLRVGVAVFGCICGNNPNRPDNGAFAEYVAVAGDLVYLLPPHLSYQDGATLGAALPTVGMAVYKSWRLRLPYPASSADQAGSQLQDVGNASAEKPHAPSSGQHVLVYGGSTVSGAVAIQMLRKSGLIPVCTCSPRNFAMVKALGAQEAFDYRSPSCGADIRRFTGDKLAYALDCIADLVSMRTCYAAIGRAGGRYMGLNPIQPRAHTRRDVKPDYILVYTMFGREVSWPRPFARPPRPKDRAFAEGWCQETQALVDMPAGIRPHPVDSGAEGWDGVMGGLDRMRKGDVSGIKLVYDLASM